MNMSEKERTFVVSSPEDGLVLHPDIEPIDPDMLQGILNRSKALMGLLSGYFEATSEQRGFKVTDKTLSNVLWQLNGNLELIEKLVSHGEELRP